MTLHLCEARTGSRGVEGGYTPAFKLGRIGFGSYVRDYTSVRVHQRSRRSNLFLPASAPAVSEKKATSHRRSHTPEALYGEGPWFTAFVDPEVVNTIRPVNKETYKKEEVVWSHRTKRSSGVESAQTAVFQLYRQGRVSPRHRLPGERARTTGLSAFGLFVRILVGGLHLVVFDGGRFGGGRGFVEDQDRLNSGYCTLNRAI